MKGYDISCYLSIGLGISKKIYLQMKWKNFIHNSLHINKSKGLLGTFLESITSKLLTIALLNLCESYGYFLLLSFANDSKVINTDTNLILLLAQGKLTLFV